MLRRMSQPKGRRPRRPTSTRYARPPKPRAQRRRARAPQEAEAANEFAPGLAEGLAVEAPPRMAYCLDCDAPFSVEDPGRHEGHLSVDLGGSTGDSDGDPRGVRSISIGEAAARAEPRWPTGWQGLDRLLGGGLVAHGVYLLSGSPGAGKCCAASTRVVNPETGAVEALGTIVARGESIPVLSVNPETLRLETHRTTAVHANGQRPVWDLVTRMGRKIRATPGHPFLTPEGWTPLAELAPGARIATPRALPCFGERTMPHPVLRFLGYAVGDGSLADGQARITASLPEIIADLGAAAEHLGCALNTYAARNSTVFDFVDATRRRGIAGVGMNRAVALLKEHGLHGKHSNEKRVPSVVFELRREDLRVFLHALFSTDGSVYVRGAEACGISYSTTSEGLARDVHHLLLRFGFAARLRRKVSTYKGEPYVAYELVLSGIAETRKFLHEIGLHGRHEAKAAIEAMPEPEGPSTHRDTVPTSPAFWERCIAANRALRPSGSFRGGTGVSDGISRGRPDTPLSRRTVERLASALPNAPWLAALAWGDVWWDEVESITPAGTEEVFDLSVPPHANFVADDIVVHNSTITMQLAASLRRQGAAVLIASGEENESQIGTRAGRLGVELDDPGLRLLATDTFDAVLSEVKALGGTEGDPDVVVVDSAQAMRLTTEPGSLGSVTQVRALGHHAVRLAKSTGRCVVVIAHVTKDGDIAGPQTLVHAVDAWLHLHRDDDDARWLKTPKNRFGPTSEVVALDMGPSGLRETRDPAALLLEDLAGEVGVAVGVAVAGDAAPVLVPVEAFVGDEENGASLASLGFARDRARFLVEALARHANIDLRDRPLRIKIPTIGGTTLSDGGLDLAVCAALLSGYYRVPLPPRWATWGEASLSGVVQRVARPEARVDALRAAVASGSLARVGEAPAPSAPGGWVPLRTPAAPGLALAPIRRLSELALAVSRLPGASALPAATVRVKVPKWGGAEKGRQTEPADAVEAPPWEAPEGHEADTK